MTDAQRAVLEGWLRRRSTAQALAQRSRIVLECAEGHSITEVSRRLRVTADTVRTWRRRFLERGPDGLCDDPRPGVPRKITDADVERVTVRTLEETPKNATHWSTRSTAAATGMSQSTISRIWRAFAPAPHRSQPVLPMMPGVPERRGHDYVRAGTTTLFAALEVATGKVIRSWLADWNEHPSPFVWTKTADEILDQVAAYCRRISDSDH
ncbi:Homeodomain-like domain-containing protein [Streptomyces zhaozhouensis]|uniref:Homeodomain-like domain-containing protein n=1 Tax=Streptomyces zhaozhouensis TaxID=1300267 RepID=A0A286DLI6_9ACTN|nr:Homeodomain-like domain-containing protein [Streptomyces zhaozhouensis]